MRPDSSAFAPRVSPTTWVALAGLLLLLGVLGVLLEGCFTKPPPPEAMPEVFSNHYPCKCDCTGLGVGAGVVTASDVNVRDMPAGNSLVLLAAGVKGVVLAGPETADLGAGNGPEPWWRVNFESGDVGWVVERLIALVDPVTVAAKTLDVCVPTDVNQNVGGHAPSLTEIVNHCTGPVTSNFGEISGVELPAGAVCTCEAQALPETYDASCDTPCPDPSQPCLAMAQDPELPTAEPLSAGVFRPTSVCEVDATKSHVDITAGGQTRSTRVNGVLNIHGRPCPGGSCQVGVSYRLKALDTIEFDSGTILASDPKFVDLNVSGATEANAIELGFFELLGFNIGELPAGAALSTAQGRRSTWPRAKGIVGRNTEGLALGVNWDTKACRLTGQLIGEADGDDADGTLGVQVDVVLDGVIVNQPPRVNAGPDQTVECTSPTGADVTLNASSSTDPDDNISFYGWRRGSESGPHVANPSANPIVKTHQAIGQTTYHLRVVDRSFAADGDSVNVSVVDTTKPTISCNAPTIAPPDQPVAFTATAADTCGVAPVVIESFECFEVKSSGQRVDKSSSCKVAIDGATLKINQSGGVGTTIRWQVRAADAASNVQRKTCELFVANPGK